jgi:hypothetical protein
MYEVYNQQLDTMATTTIVPTVVVGSPEKHYRSQIDRLKHITTTSKSIMELVQVKRHATALEEVIRKLQRDYELSQDILPYAIEVRLSCQREIGKLLAESKKKKSPPLKVSEMGLTKRESSLFQRFANASDKAFHAALEKLKTEVVNGRYKSISTKRLLEELQMQVNGKDSPQQQSSVIKPSDNWNFSSIRYPRLQSQTDDWGYIPGDLYVNCLWYYAKPGDIVVAPMAGMGQIQRVYDDRKDWMRGDFFDFTLKLLDLNPRGPYEDKIQANDLTEKLPVEKADYIIMDIPYFGMVGNQYSHNSKDIANITNYQDWLKAMHAISKNCSIAQLPQGLCTVITPNYRHVTSQEILMVTDDIRSIWTSCGYQLFDKAYASRRIQKTQNISMARLNKAAKKQRIMLTDISEILTFIKL